MLLLPLSYKSICLIPTLHRSISKPSITPCSTPPDTKILRTFSQEKRRPKQPPAMISAKRLVQMARKWQRMAALARKRLTSTPDGSSCSTSSVAGKGHCVVYSAEGRRYEVPLAYLESAILGELLSMSQEEFGFAGDEGRITLPCDATVMEYAMCLLRREASDEVERAFLSSIARPYCHYGNGLVQGMGNTSQQAAVSSF